MIVKSVNLNQRCGFWEVWRAIQTIFAYHELKKAQDSVDISFADET